MLAWIPLNTRNWFKHPEFFYLWGNLNIWCTYSIAVQDGQIVRAGSMAVCETVRTTPGIFYRVRRSLRRRAEAWIQVGRGHFEHLLWTWTDHSNSVIKHFRTHVVIYFFPSLCMRNPFLKFCRWVSLHSLINCLCKANGGTSMKGTYELKLTRAGFSFVTSNPLFTNAL